MPVILNSFQDMLEFTMDAEINSDKIKDISRDKYNHSKNLTISNNGLS